MARSESRHRRIVTLAVLVPGIVAAGPNAAPSSTDLSPGDPVLGAPPVPMPDCNGNASADPLDLVYGFSTDCDANGVPDECDGFGSDPWAVVAADACIDAPRICADVYYWGDTEEAGLESVLLCDGQFGLFDVWYRYRPASDGTVIVVTCGSASTPMVSLHEACPAPGDDHTVACDVAGDCLLVATVEAGVEYRLRLAMPGTARGAFGFSLIGPACAAPASPVRRALAGPPTALALSEDAAALLAVDTIPVVYNDHIDVDADGAFEPEDALALDAWIDANLPADYAGDVVLDYEQPWWGVLSAMYVPPSLLQQVLDVYGAVLAHAQKRRPAARWGFWGLPRLRHLSDGWATQGLDVTPLLLASDVLFPAIYDCKPGEDDTGLMTWLVEGTMARVEGARPIHVFMWPRACGQDEPVPPMLDADEFAADLQAALDATWVDGTGAVRRLDGLVLWDSTSFAPTVWDRIEMDQVHACRLRAMDAAARAAGIAP